MINNQANAVRLLVVIASYGLGNDRYIRRLIDEYRSMRYATDIVVCSNIERPLPAGVELVVGLPSKDPWSLPFAHKSIMAQRADQYELFIYSEDDTLATEQNIEAFLDISNILGPDEIAGFLRYEECPDGAIRYCDVNGHYHWDPESVVRRGDDVFGFFTNEHAAFYILTRQQLHSAIQSGGFLVTPHRAKYDLACTAATDPYTQCGMRKLICISRLKAFLLHHLPDKYVGTRFGTSELQFNKQIEALLNPARRQAGTRALIPVQTNLRDAWYSKDFYEPVRTEVVNEIPSTIQTVLSIGCGSGETERLLTSRGISVTALCLDPVIAACAHGHSVETLCGSPEQIRKQLPGRTFDCLLFSNVLHLTPHPESMIAEYSALLNLHGYCVILTPNFHTIRNAFGSLIGNRDFTAIGDYHVSGTHSIQPAILKNWMSSADIEVAKVIPLIPEHKRGLCRRTLGALDRYLASEMIVIGRKSTAPLPFNGTKHLQAPSLGLLLQG